MSVFILRRAQHRQFSINSATTPVIRQIAHVYTVKSLIVLEQYIEPCIDALYKVFDEKIASSEHGKAHVELQKWLHYFASDAVGELAVCAAPRRRLPCSQAPRTHLLTGIGLVSL